MKNQKQFDDQIFELEEKKFHVNLKVAIIEIVLSLSVGCAIYIGTDDNLIGAVAAIVVCALVAAGFHGSISRLIEPRNERIVANVAFNYGGTKLCCRLGTRSATKSKMCHGSETIFRNGTLLVTR